MSSGSHSPIAMSSGPTGLYVVPRWSVRIPPPIAAADEKQGQCSSSLNWLRHWFGEGISPLLKVSVPSLAGGGTSKGRAFTCFILCFFGSFSSVYLVVCPTPVCLFLFLPNLFCYYSLDADLFSNNPNGVLITMGEKVGGDLWGVGEGEIVIIRYCMKNIYFQ